MTCLRFYFSVLSRTHFTAAFCPSRLFVDLIYFFVVHAKLIRREIDEDESRKLCAAFSMDFALRDLVETCGLSSKFDLANFPL